MGLIAFKYHIIVFMVFIYYCKRFLDNWLITKMVNVILGLIFTIKKISDFVIPCYCFCLALLAFGLLFESNILFFIKILYDLAK